MHIVDCNFFLYGIVSAMSCFVFVYTGSVPFAQLLGHTGVSNMEGIYQLV